MTPDERIRRADRAVALLADPLFAEAEAHIEAECWRLFRELAPTDVDGLAQVKGMQYTHQKYLAFLRSAVTDGKKAAIDEKRPRPAGY
jgi:hypothetical protein